MSTGSAGTLGIGAQLSQGFQSEAVREVLVVDRSQRRAGVAQPRGMLTSRVRDQ